MGHISYFRKRYPGIMESPIKCQNLDLGPKITTESCVAIKLCGWDLSEAFFRLKNRKNINNNVDQINDNMNMGEVYTVQPEVYTVQSDYQLYEADERKKKLLKIKVVGRTKILQLYNKMKVVVMLNVVLIV